MNQTAACSNKFVLIMQISVRILLLLNPIFYSIAKHVFISSLQNHFECVWIRYWLGNLLGNLWSLFITCTVLHLFDLAISISLPSNNGPESWLVRKPYSQTTSKRFTFKFCCLVCTSQRKLTTKKTRNK